MPAEERRSIFALSRRVDFARVNACFQVLLALHSTLVAVPGVSGETPPSPACRKYLPSYYKLLKPLHNVQIPRCLRRNHFHLKYTPPKQHARAQSCHCAETSFGKLRFALDMRACLRRNLAKTTKYIVISRSSRIPWSSRIVTRRLIVKIWDRPLPRHLRRGETRTGSLGGHGVHCASGYCVRLIVFVALELVRLLHIRPISIEKGTK